MFYFIIIPKMLVVFKGETGRWKWVLREGEGTGRSRERGNFGQDI